jgi:hypothetical protein
MSSNLIHDEVRATFKEHLPALQSTVIKLRESLRQWHTKGKEVLRAADEEPDYEEFKGIYNHYIEDLDRVKESARELASLLAKFSVTFPQLASLFMGFAEASQG